MTKQELERMADLNEIIGQLKKKKEQRRAQKEQRKAAEKQ